MGKEKNQDKIPEFETLMQASDYWDENSFLDYEGVKLVEIEVDIQAEKYIMSGIS